MKQSLGNSSFDETFADPDPNHQTVRRIFSSSFSRTTMNLSREDIQNQIHIKIFFLKNQINLISFSARCNEKLLLKKHIFIIFFILLTKLDGNEGIGVGNKFVNLKPLPIWQILCLKQYKKKYKLKTADKSGNFQMKTIEIKNHNLPI